MSSCLEGAPASCALPCSPDPVAFPILSAAGWSACCCRMSTAVGCQPVLRGKLVPAAAVSAAAAWLPCLRASMSRRSNSLLVERGDMLPGPSGPAREGSAFPPGRSLPAWATLVLQGDRGGHQWVLLALAAADAVQARPPLPVHAVQQCLQDCPTWEHSFQCSRHRHGCLLPAAHGSRGNPVGTPGGQRTVICRLRGALPAGGQRTQHSGWVHCLLQSATGLDKQVDAAWRGADCKSSPGGHTAAQCTAWD